MADIKDRAREYIAKHSEYSEVFGQTFVALDTFTAMVEFAEQETKDLKAQIEGMKAELHHRLVSPSHDDSDCLDKIIGLDRLWQFGKEF